VAGTARVLRERYGVNARLAVRTACGWSQDEAAARWTQRWPDDPKTFKNISAWENWPGPTGHAPPLAVLDRLAQLYECDVADLLAGWGEHGPPGTESADAESRSLLWQVQHLDLAELARSLSTWADDLPDEHRRALLLKLSAAASMSGGPSATTARGPCSTPDELCGRWRSEYSYVSTGRARELTGEHSIVLGLRSGRLWGRSEPTDPGTIELDLQLDGQLVVGSWTERTAPDGYYRGAVYHGTLMLVVDPTGRSMRGRWLGPDRDFAVDSGVWTLTREPGTPAP
jgi:hypothetical protein